MANVKQAPQSNNNNSKDDFKKADAFVNVSVVVMVGGERKEKQIGGIPLHLDNPHHEKILSFLQKKGDDAELVHSLHVVADQEEEGEWG